jgi:hypothetical protein
MGSIGLLIFALVVWRLIPDHKSYLVLTGATLAWLAVSILVWKIRKWSRQKGGRDRSP